MNWGYVYRAVLVLLLSGLLGVLLWAVGFGIYLNRIHSHGWASTRRLLRTLPWAAAAALLLCGVVWEGWLVPQWLLARAGGTGAQVALAGRYATGNGILARDLVKARAWLARAAVSGNPEAQLTLAGFDLDGKGRGGPDPGSALGWARKAGAQGLVPARLLAGEILIQNPGLAQPGERAQAYFDGALPVLVAQARAGDAQALFSLGMLKLHGTGLALDQEGGFALLLAARSRGISAMQGFQMDLVRGALPADLIRRAQAGQAAALAALR